MRKSVFLFAVFLLWTVGCAYYYSVYIKGDTERSSEIIQIDETNPLEKETAPAQPTVSNEAISTAAEKTIQSDTLPVSNVVLVEKNRSLTLFYPEGISQLRFSNFITKRLSAVADSLAKSESGANIIAHTDNSGEPRAQFELGKKHAELIKKLFVTRGVNEENLRASSMGATQPVQINDSQKGRAANRRIVIIYNQ